jgi:hypothetical protein
VLPYSALPIYAQITVDTPTSPNKAWLTGTPKNATLKNEKDADSSLGSKSSPSRLANRYAGMLISAETTNINGGITISCCTSAPSTLSMTSNGMRPKTSAFEHSFAAQGTREPTAQASRITP